MSMEHLSLVTLLFMHLNRLTIIIKYFNILEAVEYIQIRHAKFSFYIEDRTFLFLLYSLQYQFLHRRGIRRSLIRRVKLRVAHAPGMPGTFSPPRRWAILTYITARAWRTCRDACRDRWLAAPFELGSGERVPGLPGACATRNFAYLVRGT